MTEQEKKLLQAKHRMEEAEARNRKKERSIRTRRLIQEVRKIQFLPLRYGCYSWLLPRPFDPAL